MLGIGGYAMRNYIFGGIGVVWGGAILLSYLLGFNQIRGNGAYSAGQYLGIIFGVLLFAAGIYALITEGRKKA